MTLGRISGVHGVRGWVRVQSFTRPQDNLFEYGPWLIRGLEQTVIEHRVSGRGFIVRIAGVDDREMASALVGEEIQVARSALPEPEEGAYYWADLVGLEVVCEDGQSLGRIDRLMETGAQDVMVVKAGAKEHLLPFVQGPIVREVDLQARRMVVRWEVED